MRGRRRRQRQEPDGRDRRLLDVFGQRGGERAGERAGKGTETQELAVSLCSCFLLRVGAVGFWLVFGRDVWGGMRWCGWLLCALVARFSS